MAAMSQLDEEPMSLKPGGMRGDLVAVAHPHVEQAVALGVGAVLQVANSSAECPRARTSA